MKYKLHHLILFADVRALKLYDNLDGKLDNVLVLSLEGYKGYV